MGEWLGPDVAALSGLLFNLLIILAVGGLWLMWARSLKRQKNVEDILAATSGQLEEATRHLEVALKEIQRLQAAKTPAPGTNTAPKVAPRADTPPAPSPSQAKAPEQDIEPTLTHPMHAYRRAAAPQTAPAPAPEPVQPAQQAPTDQPEDDVQRIIRLNNLGRSAEQIADQLNLPLARVNLLLRLHRQQAANQTPDGGPVAG